MSLSNVAIFRIHTVDCSCDERWFRFTLMELEEVPFNALETRLTKSVLVIVKPLSHHHGKIHTLSKKYYKRLVQGAQDIILARGRILTLTTLTIFGCAGVILAQLSDFPVIKKRCR